MIKNSKIGIRSKWVPFFLKSLLLLLHSHRADLGPDTGEGKTQYSNLRTLEPTQCSQPESRPHGGATG